MHAPRHRIAPPPRHRTTARAAHERAPPRRSRPGGLKIRCGPSHASHPPHIVREERKNKTGLMPRVPGSRGGGNCGTWAGHETRRQHYSGRRWLIQRTRSLLRSDPGRDTVEVPRRGVPAVRPMSRNFRLSGPARAHEIGADFDLLSEVKRLDRLPNGGCSGYRTRAAATGRDIRRPRPPVRSRASTGPRRRWPRTSS